MRLGNTSAAAAADLDDRGTVDAVRSPCVGICVLDRGGYCEGCLRTGAEIAAWPGMPREAQETLLKTLGLRWAQRGL